VANVVSVELFGRKDIGMSRLYLRFGHRALALGALLWIATLQRPTPAHASRWTVEYCAGPWTRWPYAAFPLSESPDPGASLSSSFCSIAGRTGHAAISLNGFTNGDESVHVWVCDDGNANCGVDEEDDGNVNTDCIAEARPLASNANQGTTSEYDGARVFQTRVPSLGAETADWPMDDNAKRINGLDELRVLCRHYTYFD
jgi:hypothetical protein